MLNKRNLCFVLAFVILLQCSVTTYAKETEDTIDPLPVIGSFDNLKELLDIKNNYDYDISVQRETQYDIESAATESKTSETNSSDYSTTNIQVQGVDESDFVKTDGDYLYQIQDNNLIISDITPPDQMHIIKKIDFQINSYAQELFIDDDFIIVISVAQETISTYNTSQDLINFPSYDNECTKISVYNKKTYKLVREVELEGRYLTSRKIDNSVYFLTNRNIRYYSLEHPYEAAPHFWDSTINADKNFNTIDWNKVKYFPDTIESNYLMIGGLSLDDLEKTMTVQAYLGSGEDIYVSNKNMYVTIRNYPNIDQVTRTIRGFFNIPTDYSPDTSIYRFVLNQGNIKYKAKGLVPGTVLNQFSMDEYNNDFRIATTKGNISRTDSLTSRNNIYILNTNLTIKGKLENVAPGEKIYSARFIGDRAYMVTFKTVDPFFVVDLHNPKKPTVLGELKIPGYSDYLHPYDENHIIGFGKETIEIDDNAYYLGMKIALFDVTDVSNPKELYKEVIGDRGTNSSILYDHKALLFSKDKNLLSFPVTVMKVKSTSSSDDPYDQLQYGEFSYQGAYVYSLDVDNGFRLKGTVTHLHQEDYNKNNDYDMDSTSEVQRIIYINDTLYTISDHCIKSNDLNTMEPINTLELPTNEPAYKYEY